LGAGDIAIEVRCYEPLAQKFDAADLLLCRDAAEKVGQGQCFSDMASGDFGSPDPRRFIVDPEVDLAPGPPFRATMPACTPQALDLDLNARDVDLQVQGSL
jgi:hypothetical protein